MLSRIIFRNKSVRHVIRSFIDKSCSNKTCNGLAFPTSRVFSSNNEGQDKDTGALPKSFSKYKIFQEEEAPIILDVEEERLKLQERAHEAEERDEFFGLNLERGIHGVFDIEDLVDVLRRERVSDLFVATLPVELNYVDYIVVVSGKSQRHILAVAEMVRKLYKRKRNPSDIIPRIEGEHSKEWIALDLGNIALHIFSPKARSRYELESLWSVGAQFDLECNKPEDPVLELIEKHSVYLGDLEPAEHISDTKQT